MNSAEQWREPVRWPGQRPMQAPGQAPPPAEWWPHTLWLPPVVYTAFRRLPWLGWTAIAAGVAFAGLVLWVAPLLAEPHQGFYAGVGVLAPLCLAGIGVPLLTARRLLRVGWLDLAAARRRRIGVLCGQGACVLAAALTAFLIVDRDWETSPLTLLLVPVTMPILLSFSLGLSAVSLLPPSAKTVQRYAGRQ